LQYHEVPDDFVRQWFVGLGFPSEFGSAYIAMLATTIDQLAVVTDDVQKILGRPAQSFEQWVSQHRAAFAG
jgi:hypothetical protein